MVDASGFAETWLCFAFTAFELLILFYGWRIKKVTWEQLWILFIECFSYGCAAAIPDAPFRNLELANGRTLPWMRFMGWLLTCPVLIMGLVSLGTVAGKASTVRMVPILVANMTMILLGITAAGIEEPGPQRIVYALAGVFWRRPNPSVAPAVPATSRSTPGDSRSSPPTPHSRGRWRCLHDCRAGLLQHALLHKLATFHRRRRHGGHHQGQAAVRYLCRLFFYRLVALPDRLLAWPQLWADHLGAPNPNPNPKPKPNLNEP